MPAPWAWLCSSFSIRRLPPVRIVCSDLAHAVPLTLVAGLGHWLIGSVDWYIVGALLVGSLPGISIGSYVAARISDRFLLPVLASILLLIACGSSLRKRTSVAPCGCRLSETAIMTDCGARISCSLQATTVDFPHGFWRGSCQP